MERVKLTQTETRVELGASSKMIIQNQSAGNVLWSNAADSDETFILEPLDSIVVDYDVWASDQIFADAIIIVARV